MLFNIERVYCITVELHIIAIFPRGGLPIKSDGGQNVGPYP